MKDLYENFNLPFEPHEYQEEGFDKAICQNKYGLWWDVGLGKTFMASAIGLQHALQSDVETLLFLVPPTLVFQWYKWWEKITFKEDGAPIDAIMYHGTPAQRKKMDFDHDVVIMSHHIFRKDYKRMVLEMSKNPNIFVTYDEAHNGLRKPSNKIWRYFRNFTANKKVLLLTATPVGNPMDTYGIVRLLDPSIYKTKRQFETTHVAEVDFFGSVTEWKNLDIMHKALYAHADKLEAREGLDLGDVIYDRIIYQLAPSHLKKYKELVNEQMLMTNDGEVLDGTDGTKLFHLLQRFVTGPDKLKIGETTAQVVNTIETIYHEDDSKLVVFANYRNTNTGILEYLNRKNIKTVGCWGDISRSNQIKNIEAFKHDPEVRVLVGNPISLGVGVDEMQYVCHRIVFAELPIVPREFYQSVGRIDRQGQKRTVVVKALIANGTIQGALWHSLMNKDDLINKIVKNKSLLRGLFS